MMASRYWKTPSIAATGLSSTERELKELMRVPPMLCLIFFITNFPSSFSVPQKSLIYMLGMLIFSSLTAGMRMKYSMLTSMGTYDGVVDELLLILSIIVLAERKVYPRLRNPQILKQDSLRN